MNPITTRHLRQHSSFLALLFLLTTLLTSPAQSFATTYQPTNGLKPFNRSTPLPQPQHTLKYLITMDFPGGTAAEYLNALQHQVPDANIIIMKDVDKIMIPANKLKSVSLDAAIQLLKDQNTSEGRFNYALDYDELLNGKNQEPIYVVRANQSALRVWVDDSIPPVQSKVWAIDPLLKTLSSDDILAAIDVALPLAAEGKPNAEIRFHKETGLLIARGGDQELNMIDQLLKQLHDTADNRAQVADRHDTIGNQYKQIMELKTQLQQANDERDEFNRQAEGIKARVEEEERIIVELREKLKSTFASNEKIMNDWKMEAAYLRDSMKDMDKTISNLKQQLKKQQNKP